MAENSKRPDKYFLKVPFSFWDNPQIRALLYSDPKYNERYLYIGIYFRLLRISKEHDGTIYPTGKTGVIDETRKVLKISQKKLLKILNFFSNLGMIELSKNGDTIESIKMTQYRIMTEKESDSAQRVRDHRERKKQEEDALHRNIEFRVKNIDTPSIIPPKGKKKDKNKFNQHEQQTYDFAEMERILDQRSRAAEERDKEGSENDD